MFGTVTVRMPLASTPGASPVKESEDRTGALTPLYTLFLQKLRKRRVEDTPSHLPHHASLPAGLCQVLKKINLFPHYRTNASRKPLTTSFLSEASEDERN
jgi:hypothetical protein